MSESVSLTVGGAAVASYAGTAASTVALTVDGTVVYQHTVPAAPTKATVSVGVSNVTNTTATLSVKVTPGTDGATLTTATVGRDGTDSSGTGAWSGPLALTKQSDGTYTGSTVFNLLKTGTTYTLTATDDGVSASVSLTTGAPTPTPTPAPSGGGGSTGTGTSAAKFAALTLPALGRFSGSAGNGVDGGSDAFGTWRGLATGSISNWLDAADGAGWNQGILGSTPSGPVVGDTRALNLAIGGPSDWSKSASGSMDTAFRTAMTNLRKNRTIGGVIRPTFVRFAHELNGNWYAWSVKAGQEANVRATFTRLKSILDQVFPEAFWEICYNGENTTGAVKDADLFVTGVHDLVGVDRYNQYPFIGTTSKGVYTSWADGSARQGSRGPIGIEAWRQFAAARGVPISMPEYGNNSATDGSGGDDSYWPGQLYPYLKANQGKGAGQFVLENWFNIGTQWAIYGSDSGAQPKTAAAYNAQF